MTAKSHGRNDLDKIIHVNTIKVGGKNASLPYPRFNWKPITDDISPAYSAIQICIPLYDDVEEYEWSIST